MRKNGKGRGWRGTRGRSNGVHLGPSCAPEQSLARVAGEMSNDCQCGFVCAAVLSCAISIACCTYLPR